MSGALCEPLDMRGDDTNGPHSGRYLAGIDRASQLSIGCHGSDVANRQHVGAMMTYIDGWTSSRLLRMLGACPLTEPLAITTESSRNLLTGTVPATNDAASTLRRARSAGESRRGD